MIYWAAKNNSSFLNGYRNAKTMRSAVRDARRYVVDELYGEGTITYYDKKPDSGDKLFDPTYPIREDECSIFTKFQWVSK